MVHAWCPLVRRPTASLGAHSAQRAGIRPAGQPPHRSVRIPMSRSRLPSRRGVSSGLRIHAGRPRRLRGNAEIAGKCAGVGRRAGQALPGGAVVGGCGQLVAAKPLLLTACLPRQMRPSATFRCLCAAACLLSSCRADSSGRCGGLCWPRRSIDPAVMPSNMQQSCRVSPHSVYGNDTYSAGNGAVAAIAGLEHVITIAGSSTDARKVISPCSHICVPAVRGLGPRCPQVGPMVAKAKATVPCTQFGCILGYSTANLAAAMRTFAG